MCCGSTSSMLLTEDGEVFAWGKNYDGQLGLGHRLEQVIIAAYWKIQLFYLL